MHVMINTDGVFKTTYFLFMIKDNLRAPKWRNSVEMCVQLLLSAGIRFLLLEDVAS